MALKTFWTIFVKIFGLYLIWQALLMLPSFLSSIVFAGGEDKASFFTMISLMIFLICFFVLIIRFCILQTDWVVEKLRLGKGFDEDKIEVNVHRSSLLSVAIIVLGGLMLADGLPVLVYQSFYYISHSDATTKFRDNPATPFLISNLLKVFIGYFMAADSRLIVNFIERKKRKAVTKNDDIAE